MEEARFTMRIHPVIMEKVKYIAKQNGRTINKEIEQILKWVVTDYENKYGRITIDTKKKEAKEASAPALDIDIEELYK